jgi:hypothetical protein
MADVSEAAAAASGPTLVASSCLASSASVLVRSSRSCQLGSPERMMHARSRTEAPAQCAHALSSYSLYSLTTTT